MQPLTAAFTLLAIGFFFIRWLHETDVPKIKNLPEPRGIPIFGNLLQLGNEHAKRAAAWAKQLGPVFQRIVFVNTFDTVKHFWVTNQSALISRPTLHTFHSVVSTSQGFTIGTSPWDESCKRRRKAAATALNRPAVQSYMPIIDLEATASIKEFVEDADKAAVGGKPGEVDPHAYFARFALNTSLTLNYGFRISGNVSAPLLTEITHVEREVSNLRSTSNNWQDYVPLMRLWPGGKNAQAGTYRERRDVYMGKLLDMLKEKIANGTDTPCITGNILKDPEAKLNDAEIKSICLSMVSAGLDTVPGNLIMSMGYLSSPHGQQIQARAREEIAKIYPNGDAWERCLVEEKVGYVTAFVKETLRFWTVIPICLPRVSVRDLDWNGAKIPAGTTFFMNAWAADYDTSHFQNPEVFNPDRYILDKSDSATGTPHYGYGAGSRMCAGSHLANRELYTAFLRIFESLDILPPAQESDRPVLDSLGCNAQPTSLTTDPKPFKVAIRVRDREKLQQWVQESEERTKDIQ